MALHNALTGVELHEPKDIAAAATGEVYVSDGAGSGAMRLPMGDKNVVINALADLPTPAGGLHTLAADTNYIFTAAITTANAFKFSSNTTVTAMSGLSPLLTYTGTGAMFVGADVSCNISEIKVTCPTANLFDISETGGGGTKSFSATRVNCVACLRFATFDKLAAQLVNLSTAQSCTDGIVVTGAIGASLGLANVSFRSTDVAYIGLDLTGAVLNTISLATVVFVGGAGSIGIKGDAASANITTNFIGQIKDCSFTGVTTPLSGITIDDIRWAFRDNGVVADSQPDGLVSLSSNATVTTLSVGVPTLVAGTWAVERVSQFTGTTAGRLTYNAERDLLSPLDVAIVVDPVSGTNKSIRAFIAINGAAIVISGKAILIDAGSPAEITIMWQEKLSENEFIEVFIENETDSVDVTVIDAVLRVR